MKDAAEFLTHGGTAAQLQTLITPPVTAEAEPRLEISLEKTPDGALRACVQGREYRVRGLAPVGLERLKVNLRLSVGGAFHLDTLDLYQARARATFAQAATRTDPQTGKLHTEHYEVHGPVSIVITTISPEAFDEETRSRFVPLSLDEFVVQTRAILTRQRRRYSLEGVLEQATTESVRRRYHNAQRLLRPLRVVNPFHAWLTYPDERLIHRREQQEYLSLINAIALLHQHQREIKRAATDELEIEYVEVTLSDIALANELTQATLARSLDELAPPVRGMYQEIRRLCEQRAAQLQCAPDEVQLTRREIREATGWSDWQVRVYCQQLLELEYLSAASGANGKKFCYELAWYSAEQEPRPLLRGLADVEQLKQQLKKNG